MVLTSISKAMKESLYMKKIIALALILTCVFVIASCDNNQNETPNGTSSGVTDPVTDVHVHEYGVG